MCQELASQRKQTKYDELADLLHVAVSCNGALCHVCIYIYI